MTVTIGLWRALDIAICDVLTKLKGTSADRSNAQSRRLRPDWTDDTEVTVYLESTDECTLKRCLLKDVKVPTNGWQGRIFDETMEVRWSSGSPDKISVWATWELKENQSPASKNWVGDPFGALDTARLEVVRESRRYYMIGIGPHKADGKVATFQEGRYPGRSFEYPVGDASNAPVRSRAYIEVYEYRRMEPDWEEFRDDLDEDGLDKLRDLVDAPILVAHRFVKVGCGVDPEEVV